MDNEFVIHFILGKKIIESQCSVHVPIEGDNVKVASGAIYKVINRTLDYNAKPQVALVNIQELDPHWT